MTNSCISKLASCSTLVSISVFNQNPEHYQLKRWREEISQHHRANSCHGDRRWQMRRPCFMSKKTSSSPVLRYTNYKEYMRSAE